MNINAELRRSLRRLRPERRFARLERRDRKQLRFLVDLSDVPEMLLDSTVYIDQLQGRLPDEVAARVGAGGIWHSTVTEAELTALAGLLDPRHPNTAHVLREVLGSVEQRRPHRIVNPDREVWAEAGALSGLLARLQQYGKSEQRRALNDALILLSAAKMGLSVLTRNLADYDLLMQLAPHGKVIFYEV